MTKPRLNPYLFAGTKQQDRTDYLLGPVNAHNTPLIVQNVEDAVAMIKVRYPESDVFTKDRKAINIEARRALIWILTKQLRKTTVSVGKLLGLHHSTVISHRDKFENGISPFPSDIIIKKLFDQ
jgi:chromosomal replication initiation ATPase DnaA